MHSPTRTIAAALAAGTVLAPAAANAGVIAAQAPAGVSYFVPTAGNPVCTSAGDNPWMEFCGYQLHGQRTDTLVLIGRLHAKASSTYDAKVMDWRFRDPQVTRITSTIRPSASFQQLGTVPGFTYSGYSGNQSLCLAIPGGSDCDPF